MKRPLFMSLVLAGTLGACSEKAPVDVTPFTPNLSRSTHVAWFDYVQPKLQELGWTLWNWNPQLAPAARMASASGKPLLLWLERGHPLGSTSAAGIQRRTLWMDVSLNNSLARFQFAADDLNVLLESDDAEGSLLAGLLAQAADDGSGLCADGGVLMASAGGELLGSYSGQDAAALKEELTAAWANWDQLPREQRRLADMSAMVSTGRTADLFPDDGMALEVHRRILSANLDLAAERSMIYTHDYLWFSAAELAPIVPTKMDATMVLPDAQAQRIALFLLVDDLHGDGQAFAIEDLQQSTLTFKGISKVGNTVRFSVSGEFSAVDTNQRGMRCVVEGMGSANIAQGMIASLNLAVQAQSWGPEIEPMADGSWPLLGMGVRRADSFEGSHRIAPAQFHQYPTNWPVTE